jgi:acyl dehydratase
MTMSDTDTTGRLVTDVTGLLEHAGRDLGRSEWREMDQDRVDRFADVTEDHNFIHVDPQRAAATPFGGTIAHGFLTLSLLAPLLAELLVVEGASASVNYGLDRLRFPAPLRVGDRFRAAAQLTEAKQIEGGVQIKVVATIEIEDGPKPALAADCLFRHYA